MYNSILKYIYWIFLFLRLKSNPPGAYTASSAFCSKLLKEAIHQTKRWCQIRPKLYPYVFVIRSSVPGSCNTCIIECIVELVAIGLE